MKVCKLYNSVDSSDRDLGDSVWFWCPGCRGYHSPRVRMPADPTAQEMADMQANRKGLWSWNKNEEAPTFSPSILVWASDPSIRCHSYVTDGKIQFLEDCGHALKGQTVPLEEFEL